MQNRYLIIFNTWKISINTFNFQSNEINKIFLDYLKFKQINIKI